MDQPLPPNWKSTTDPRSGRVYYYNTKTKERSWNRPQITEENEEHRDFQANTTQIQQQYVGNIQDNNVVHNQPSPSAEQQAYQTQVAAHSRAASYSQQQYSQYPNNVNATNYEQNHENIGYTNQYNSNPMMQQNQVQNNEYANPSNQNPYANYGNTGYNPDNNTQNGYSNDYGVHNTEGTSNYNNAQRQMNDPYNNNINAHAAAETHKSPSPAASEEPTLPPGWERRFDENSKRYYYCNRKLQKSQWYPPATTRIVTRPDQLPTQQTITYKTNVPGTATLIPTNMQNQSSSANANKELTLNTKVAPQNYRPDPSSSGPSSSSNSSDYLLAKTDAHGGILHSLPPELKASIHSFQMEGFARSHFAKHKKGFLFLKKPIPLAAMISFQRDPLKMPLLENISKSKDKQLVKDALANFDDILIYTGIKKTGKSSGKEISPVQQISMNKAAGRIAQRGSNNSTLRDEIYTQLIKQTTPSESFSDTLERMLNLESRRTGKAPSNKQEKQEKDKDKEKREAEEFEQMQAIEKAWQLINLCCDNFAPSRDFERTLLAHIDKAVADGEEEQEDDYGENGEDRKRKKKKERQGYASILENFLQRVSVLAQYALNRLQNLTLFSVQKKGVVVKIDESRISDLQELANTKQVFGCALNEILMRQEKNEHFTYTAQAYSGLVPLPQECTVKGEKDFGIPVVASYLSMKLCSVEGLKVEGIFRKCITIDETEQSVKKLNEGNYNLDSQNAHTYAVLMKTWLKRLTNPLVPFALYDQAIQVSNSTEDTVAFAETQLPKPNLLLLKYLCRFLRVVCHADYVESNKMNGSNLALIFAPTLIRMDSDKPQDAVKNLKSEIQFVFSLILKLFPTEDEERHFSDCDTFLITQCGMTVDPAILGLFRIAGRSEEE